MTIDTLITKREVVIIECERILILQYNGCVASSLTEIYYCLLWLHENV